MVDEPQSGREAALFEVTGKIWLTVTPRQSSVRNGDARSPSLISEGIFVSAGGSWIEGNGVSQPLGSNVTVQNSTAHDIYGDDILIAELNHGLLQSNAVYKSGLCPDCSGSTPVGLWEWYCHTCTVQNNESYANQSWGGDGGDFDIDYFNENNVVQYNYGHGQRSVLSKQGEVFGETVETRV